MANEEPKDLLMDNNCSICLSTKNDDVGAISCCKHTFHLHCIKQWSKITNKCPLCKLQFSYITSLKTSELIKVNDKEQRNADNLSADLIESSLIGEVGEIDDQPCSICHENGNDEYALICDGCENIFHSFCVGLGLEVPSDPVWFCSDCSHLYVDDTETNINEDGASEYDPNEDAQTTADEEEWTPLHFAERKKQRTTNTKKKINKRKPKKRKKQIEEMIQTTNRNKRKRKRCQEDEDTSNENKRRKLFKHEPFTAAANLYCPHSDCSDNDLFLFYDEFENHMEIFHNDSSPYKCEKCGRKYGTKSHLIQHIGKTHKQITKYECITCGKGFHHKVDWKRHCMVHSKERPFECSQCAKTFAQSANLTRHILCVHDRKVKFECNACGKGFYDKRKFNIHCRIHKEERPFECDQCNLSFNNRSKLTAHIQGVHEKKVNYQCDKCQKGFYRKYDYKQHLKRKTSCV